MTNSLPPVVDSEGSALLELERAVAERWRVSPVDMRATVVRLRVSTSDVSVLRPAYTFACRKLGNFQPAESDALAHELCHAVWNQLKAALPEGSTVIWRVRPAMEVNHFGVTVRCRLACADELLFTAQPVPEGGVYQLLGN